MDTPPVRVERRVGQRFPYLLPVSLRNEASGAEGVGFTQDLSSRGVFLFTDTAVPENAILELTLRMPSEITLGESMRVRCRGRVLRVVRPTANLSGTPALAETKIGVAVRLEHYEYLVDPAEAAANLARVSGLHAQRENEEPAARFFPRSTT